jgi:hypothetical protein
MLSGQGLVGSWRLTVFEDEGPPTLALATFGTDGTVVTAEHPVVTPPGAPGVIFTSSGHGMWKARGPDTAIFTFVGLGSNGQGQLFAVVDLRARITLGTNGQEFSGEFVATISDRSGDTLATYPGTLQALRIAAEAAKNSRMVAPTAATSGP